MDRPKEATACDMSARALRLAREAVNSWACFAKRKAEHDAIARLHREIDALSAQQQPHVNSRSSWEGDEATDAKGAAS